jgi:septum formation topological specificity factor MinE
MKDEILKTLVQNADAQIQKHKTNVEIHLQNPAGVAEHPDHLDTIEKEIELIAKYIDIKDAIKTQFGEGKSLLKE